MRRKPKSLHLQRKFETSVRNAYACVFEHQRKIERTSNPITMDLKRYEKEKGKNKERNLSQVCAMDTCVCLSTIAK